MLFNFVNFPSQNNNNNNNSNNNKEKRKKKRKKIVNLINILFEFLLLGA